MGKLGVDLRITLRVFFRTLTGHGFSSLKVVHSISYNLALRMVLKNGGQCTEFNWKIPIR